MTARPLSILVVDDHPLFRAGVVAMLSSDPGMVVAGEADTGKSAIEAFRTLRPDVAVVDLMLPDLSGDQVIVAMRSIDPLAKVVMLTTYAGDASARRALAAGAQGYLLKTSLADDLVSTVRSIYAGEQRVSSEVAQQLAEHSADECLTEREISADECLTEREIAVLRGVGAGLSNKQIAQRLGLSPETVKEYLSNAMGKLHASNPSHALAIALERGFFR
ncbi:two-component system NarL family response regulator [Luteibacter sp. W1I16]|uniref:response regulator transcription factor n=1 Tax=Luteibacter sp. W1I16 TaxID=3373922 RepID=UPI003D217394